MCHLFFPATKVRIKNENANIRHDTTQIHHAQAAAIRACCSCSTHARQMQHATKPCRLGKISGEDGTRFVFYLYLCR